MHRDFWAGSLICIFGGACIVYGMQAVFSPTEKAYDAAVKAIFFFVATLAALSYALWADDIMLVVWGY